jgi:hypothetical protein
MKLEENQQKTKNNPGEYQEKSKRYPSPTQACSILANKNMTKAGTKALFWRNSKSKSPKTL